MWAQTCTHLQWSRTLGGCRPRTCLRRTWVFLSMVHAHAWERERRSTLSQQHGRLMHNITPHYNTVSNSLRMQFMVSHRYVTVAFLANQYWTNFNLDQSAFSFRASDHLGWSHQGITFWSCVWPPGVRIRVRVRSGEEEGVVGFAWGRELATTYQAHELLACKKIRSALHLTLTAFIPQHCALTISHQPTHLLRGELVKVFE